MDEAYTDTQLLALIAALPEPGDGRDARAGKEFLSKLVTKYDQQTLFDFVAEVESAHTQHRELTLEDLDQPERYLLRQMRGPVISRRDAILSTLTIGGLGGFLMQDGAKRLHAEKHAPEVKQQAADRFNTADDVAEIAAGGMLLGVALHTKLSQSSLEDRLAIALRAAKALIARQQQVSKER